jgi:uncharacterized secreted protein with C-terminal beta-propeller domain
MSSQRQSCRFRRPTVELLEDRSLPAIVGTPIVIDPPITIEPRPVVMPAIFGPFESSPAAVAPVTFGSESALIQHLIDDALNRYSDLFGRQAYWWNWWNCDCRYAIDSPVAFSATTASAAANSSSTNVQVAGVDEGDLVKTDGAYLYVLTGQELVILQAQPASALHVISTTTLEGQADALYLDGDRVTVISTVWPTFDADGSSPALRPSSVMTKVTVFDVSDRAAPRTVQETYADGSLQSSRAVGDRVYVVLQNYSAVLPAPLLLNKDGQWVYETQDEYLARIAGHEIELTQPYLYTNSGGSLQRTGLITDPANLYQPQSFNDTSLISVLAFDVTSDSAGPVGSTSAYASYGSIVYATADHLYVVSSGWVGQSSVIYQFALDGDHIELAAVGVVPGSVKDRFSLDESGGYLRVATTVGWEGTGSNGVYVLAPEAGVLTVVGSVEGIAPGEDIRAAYFQGDRAYLVTFHQCDPLFILDLSVPTAPRVVGQLQLPGYSTYLQPLDATHLLGVGRDADGSLKIALFDVSDPTAPRQVDVYDISAAGSWRWGTGSAAEYDPHALSYFPETHTLALPIYTNSYWWGGIALDRAVGASLEVMPVLAWPIFAPPAYVSSLEVFQVDFNTGFHFLGSIDSDSQVLRSVRIGDTLYSVAADSVQAYPLDDPTAPGGTEARLDGNIGTLQAVLQYAAPGTPFDGEVLEFTAGDATNLTAAIDWGDGQTSDGEVVALGDGHYAVRGNHTYTTAGQFEFKVTFSGAGTPWCGPSFSAWVNVAEPAAVGPASPDDAGPSSAQAEVVSEAVPAAAPPAAPAQPVSPNALVVQALTPVDAAAPASSESSPQIATDSAAPTPVVGDVQQAPGGVSAYDGLGGSGHSPSAEQSPTDLELGVVSDRVEKSLEFRQG